MYFSMKICCEPPNQVDFVDNLVLDAELIAKHVE